MRVLWIVNIIMPELAEHIGKLTAPSGSWLVDISDGLSKEKDIDIAIAAIGGDEFKKYELGDKTYYLIPGSGRDMYMYSKNVEKHWHKVYEDFKPDLVHIHGTEYSHGLSFMRKYHKVPSILSIQGVLNKIKNVDFGGVPLKHYIFGRTLKQWIRMNGEIENHFLHCKNAVYEKEMFLRARAVNGVTVWDTSIAKMFNPGLDVYTIEYNLRDEYYKANKWDIENIERYSIFTNPSGTPLKGLHKLIEAAALLKDKYPDIKIKVPGMAGKDGNVIVTTAYTRYLYKLIKKLGMVGHVEFLGKQTTGQMIENAQKAHIAVIPSAIEGASLVLREAMFLGCPCISSFRGGMADFITDKIDGFVYDFPEHTVLAARIEQLFESDELCKTISENGKKKAEKAHERKNNVSAYVNMYNRTLKKEK